MDAKRPVGVFLPNHPGMFAQRTSSLGVLIRDTVTSNILYYKDQRPRRNCWPGNFFRGETVCDLCHIYPLPLSLTIMLAPILYPSQVSASESVLLDLRSANLANLGFLTRVQLLLRLQGMGHEIWFVDFLSSQIICTKVLTPSCINDDWTIMYLI